MKAASSNTAKGDLAYAAAVIALAIGMIAAAALLYHLVDILLVLFLGIVVAAALQPVHLRLSRWGVPKGLAVLLIYLLFIASIVEEAVHFEPHELRSSAQHASARLFQASNKNLQVVWWNTYMRHSSRKIWLKNSSSFLVLLLA